MKRLISALFMIALTIPAVFAENKSHLYDTYPGTATFKIQGDTSRVSMAFGNNHADQSTSSNLIEFICAKDGLDSMIITFDHDVLVDGDVGVAELTLDFSEGERNVGTFQSTSRQVKIMFSQPLYPWLEEVTHADAIYVILSSELPKIEFMFYTVFGRKDADAIRYGGPADCREIQD